MKANTASSIQTTNTLKGIAILAVVVNHYLLRNIAGNYTGYANAWIAIFFFLSGYGLFHSLNRRNPSSISQWLAFYYQRAIRIFPLLWIAWCIEFIIRRGTGLSIWTLFGIHGTAQYWFIPTILQCYLATPFLFSNIRKKPIITLASLTAIITAFHLFLTHQAPIQLIFLTKFIHADWRGVYFLYILVFALGLFTAPLLQNHQPKGLINSTEKPSKTRRQLLNRTIITALLWSSIVLINMVMFFMKLWVLENPNHYCARFSLNVFPVVLIVLLCLGFLYYFVNSRFFEYFGRISYSIYLFHISFYFLMDYFGPFPWNSIRELAFCLTFFPLFLLACQQLERLGDYLGRKLQFKS